MLASKQLKMLWGALAAIGFSAAIAADSNPSVNWIKCPASVPAPIECGTINVPLDHAHPHGSTITLSLTRLPANDSSGHSQALYIENGGPGAPNTNTMFGVLDNEESGKDIQHWAPLRRMYDIIGVDMRGTGDSQPVKCDADLYVTVQWPMIKDQRTYDETMARNRAWAQTCVNMTGPLINHLGTDQAVQDYEMVRQALSHEKFNYLGFSYGTQLGSEYADMFPDKVGRMVFDGVVNRHLAQEDRFTTAAAGFESALGDFFQWCNTTTDCALYGRDQVAIWDWIVETSARGELHSTGCVGSTCGDGSIVTDWQIILDVELAMHDGNTILGNSTENYQTISRTLNFTYVEKSGLAFQNKPPPAGSTVFSQWAITCSDRPDRTLSVDDFRNIWTVTPLLATHSRGLGLLPQTITICNSWPVKPLNPPRAFNQTRQKLLPPIMLVNSFYDPAALSPWGLGMRSLMPTAFSIYRNGSGHTSFNEQGETAGAMTAFLVNGTKPEDGTIYQS